jgi:hypothetical protein
VLLLLSPLVLTLPVNVVFAALTSEEADDMDDIPADVEVIDVLTEEVDVNCGGGCSEPSDEPDTLVDSLRKLFRGACVTVGGVVSSCEPPAARLSETGVGGVAAPAVVISIIVVPVRGVCAFFSTGISLILPEYEARLDPDVGVRVGFL